MNFKGEDKGFILQYCKQDVHLICEKIIATN